MRTPEPDSPRIATPLTMPPAVPPVVPQPEPSMTMIYTPEELSPEVAPAAAEPEPELEPPREVVTLSFEGREVPVTGDRVVLGRSRECDIRLADANASRRHAEVRHEDGSYWVIDLGSTNGTELNGRRVERAQLSDGDRITLGATDIRFRLTQP